MESRSRNAKRNTVWGMVNRVLSLLLPFATRTVIIRVLGSEYLGLSSLFTSILTVLNLAELGFGSAIVYSMYKPLAENDSAQVCALLGLYRKIYRVIGIAVLCAGCALTPFIKFFIHGDPPQDINVYYLYLMYIGNTAVSYLLFAYKTSLLHATQRDDIISKTSSVFNILVNLVRIAVVIFFKNYYLFVLVMVVCTILQNLINAYAAKKLYPMYFCQGEVTSTVKGEIYYKVKGLLMIKIASVSRNALDSIILSSFFGLTVVTAYDNYYYIINAVTSLLLVIMRAIAAGIGNGIATETKESNLQKMRIMNYLFLSISGACAACMVSSFQDFILLWVGEKMLFSNMMMILFVFYFILMKIGDVQAQFFDGAGLWWHGRMRGFIEAGANLALNIILGYFLGSLGVLIATIITIILINFPLSTYYTFKYYYNKSPKGFIIEQIRIVSSICISCVPATFISFLWINHIDGGTVSYFCIMALKALMGLLLYLAVFYVIYRNNALAKKSVKWIKGVLRA